MVIIGIYLLLNTPKDDTVTTEVYQKIENKISKRSPNVKELERAQLTNKIVKKSERELSPPTLEVEGLTPVNSPSDNWEKALVQELLRFQTAETIVLVTPTRSLIIRDKGKLRYAEEVIVSFQNQKQVTGGFTALVDSETGKIIKTWNRIKWLFPLPPLELPEVN